MKKITEEEKERKNRLSRLRRKLSKKGYGLVKPKSTVGIKWNKYFAYIIILDTEKETPFIKQHFLLHINDVEAIADELPTRVKK